MKNLTLTIIVLTTMVGSGIIINVSSSTPVIRLPPSFVTMLAKNGTNSWFDEKLSEVPTGYDLTNGTYRGWCAQENVEMTRNVNHTVRLYSCYDSSMPPDFQSENWSKINYILNHKQGNVDSVQYAIWYYLNFEEYPSDNDSQAMIADANENGIGFIPHSGEVIAILVYGVPAIQRTFIEFTIPTPQPVGHLVWYDSDRDGNQDERESGIANVTVRLYSSTDILINSTTTNDKGYYSFSNLSYGEYYLQFVLQNEYKFSPQNMGSNTFIDSDANVTTGKTNHFIVDANTNNFHWDAGMYEPFYPRREGKNHPPTADASAGEPYRGIIQKNVTFNGSRSYDRDGRIVKWSWNFGDGTNGTGVIIKHAYITPGEYTVVFTVTDNYGATDTYITTTEITTGNTLPSTPVINGPKTGRKNKSYNYTVVSTNPDANFLQYIFEWDDDTVTTTDLLLSGIPTIQAHSWSVAGHYTLKVKSIYNNSESETANFTIWIDVWDITDIGYLIDQNSDGTYDIFHNDTTGIETIVKKIGDGGYLIDSDGDGTWNYIFHLDPEVLQAYYPIPIEEYILVTLLLTGPVLVYLVIRKKREESIEKTPDLQTIVGIELKELPDGNQEEKPFSIK
jgi:PKD repeat protein